jgi:hypothetical protein
VTQFYEHPLVRALFKQLGSDPETEVAPLAVQDWKFEKRSHQVIRLYRIKTKELEGIARLSVASTEPDAAGMERKWFVKMTESGFQSKKLTPLGEGLVHLRSSARAHLLRWMGRLNEGEPYPQIAAVDKGDWKAFILVGLDPKQGIDPRDTREMVHKFFVDNSKQRFLKFEMLSRPEADVGNWEDVGGKIRVHYVFRITLPRGPGLGPFAHVDGKIALETTAPIDPAKYAPHMPEPSWEIVAMEFTQMMPAGGPQEK